MIGRAAAGSAPLKVTGWASPGQAWCNNLAHPERGHIFGRVKPAVALITCVPDEHPAVADTGDHAILGLAVCGPVDNARAHVLSCLARVMQPYRLT
ncbi:MAG TPA: hypothetical protein VLL69_13120, partial [Streptosporangiaceae bacterium]|nr:hypothetical protein [Streptosporangiaceae bacterium]